MRRLERKDWVLLLTVLPVWLVCFALHVYEVRNSGTALATAFAVRAWDGGEYPVLGGVRPDRSGHLPEVRVGDRLLRAGDRDLRGVGYLRFEAIVAGEAGRDLRTELEYDRDGERRTTWIALEPDPYPWARVPAHLAFALVAVAVLLRSPSRRFARWFFVCVLALSINQMPFYGPSYGLTLANQIVFLIAGAVGLPVALRAAIEFPEKLADKLSARWACVGLLLSLPPRIGYLAGGPVPPSITPHVVLLCDAIFLLTLFAILTRNYLRSGPVGRRQVKWVLLGIYLGITPLMLTVAAAALVPGFRWLGEGLGVSSVLALAMPLCMLIGMLRYGLFDVDRLISSTAAYSVLLAAAAAGVLVAVPRLAIAASGVIGLDPGTSQVALSVVLAGLLVPAHQRLRPQIDRVFFRESFALDHGIADLLAGLSGCADARELTERAGDGLYGLLRPEGCVIYARVGAGFASVFVRERTAPTAFEVDSPLIAALAKRRGPLALSNDGRTPDVAPLGPFDRAALEALEAEVVVPLRRDDALVAFLCLGPKRSGDLYTSTDLSHLASVAEKVSMEFLRFDQEATIREAREMQESLRRYVPGAVAEQLSHGAHLEAGEREVSVLFVDIRGYTTFAESRRAEEIFSTVNRFTEFVSEIVRRHGGSVVEFNGDGMMAVFGAPQAIAEKERAAVGAGRDIVTGVGSLPIEDAPGKTTTLSVGVGIATGEAFVGNIHAVDRMIWSAIGNTTNLAARLQGLTRELEAPLVIDAATWGHLGRERNDFERRADAPIRGRSVRQDVYALPMPAHS